ncbi:hypothetical protein GCM10020331_090700 [Ectobacillus funiculus]
MVQVPQFLLYCRMSLQSIFLNQLHFHIGTMGNHEFDEGINELLRLINGGTHAKKQGISEEQPFLGL